MLRLMAKIHRIGVHCVLRRHAGWVRNMVTSLTFLASFAALGLILHNQYNGTFLLAVIKECISPFGFTQAVASPSSETISPISSTDVAQYQVIGEYLARRYRVSSEIATKIVAKTYTTGRSFDLDPLLILAVISVESSFNPIAESRAGAKGLMQVIPRLHEKKFDAFGGPSTVFKPETNILVGTEILKEYLMRTGDLNDALHRYVGASSLEAENGYPEKVLAQRARLYQVLRQYQNQNRQQLAQF